MQRGQLCPQCRPNRLYLLPSDSCCFFLGPRFGEVRLNVSHIRFNVSLVRGDGVIGVRRWRGRRTRLSQRNAGAQAEDKKNSEKFGSVHTA